MCWEGLNNLWGLKWGSKVVLVRMWDVKGTVKAIVLFVTCLGTGPAYYKNEFCLNE